MHKRRKRAFLVVLVYKYVTINRVDHVFTICQMIDGLQEVFMASLNKPILDLIVDLPKAQLAIHVDLCNRDSLHPINTIQWFA